jgi:hypothetical protein
MSFVVDTTKHLQGLSVKLQEMADLITSLYGNMKAFKIQIRLLEAQITMYI